MSQVSQYSVFTYYIILNYVQNTQVLIPEPYPSVDWLEIFLW